MKSAVGLRLVLILNNLVGVAGQLAEQLVGGRERINANPVFGREVGRLAYAVATGSQLLDALGLAFQRNDAEVVAVEESKHVAVNVEHQYAAGIVEGREGQFLLHVSAQRQAVVTIVFDIHLLSMSG